MNYTLKTELGSGGMATVYLAEDHKFHTDVAVKMLKKEFVNNENIRKRFIAEARNMFKMSHPNIIKVTDLIEQDDTVAFVMEYIEGETLKEYLERKGKLSDAEIKNLFSQMLEAVGYVHEQNLVHRDIKPSNFMITSKGQIKLLDFGIAKTTEVTSAEYTQTGTGVQMGTPMYMSPEQVKSSKEVSHITDIYSLGVVLWQMVMAEKPYDTNELSLPEIQVNIIKKKLPNTSSIFDDIIQKATQKHSEKRFQNIQAFQDAIKHPIKNSDLEQTIVNSKTLAEEETVVLQSNKRANSAKSSEISPTSKKESFTNHLPPLKENKQSLNKLIYIGIGVILLAVLLFRFKEEPVEKAIDDKTKEEELVEINEDFVKSKFFEYLKNISDNRELSNYTIKLGDLNGDNLLDAVVNFSQYPTVEERNEIGNSMLEFPGIITFINTGKNLRIVDHSESFGGIKGINLELKNISNGVIILEGKDYQDSDAMCCPSLFVRKRIVLRNDKLVDLD